MKRNIGVLLVEHTQEAARSLVQAIRRGGFEVTGRRVESPAALTVALRSDDWDLVVCGLGHPDIDARTVLGIVREASPDLPFVVTAQTVDEETMSALLRAGADDCVVTGNGDRMGSTVRRCLEEAEQRRRQRLRDDSYRALVEDAPQGMLIIRDGLVELANAAAADVLGRSGETLQGLRVDALVDAFHPRDRDKVKACWAPPVSRAAGAESVEAMLRRAGAGARWVEISSRATVVAGRPAVHSTVVDIGARRERQREFEAIGTLATALRWVGSRPEAVQLLLDQTLDLLSADAAALAMRNALSGDVVIERANGLWAGTVSGRLGDSASLTRKVVRSGNAFVGSVGADDDDLSWPEVAAFTRFLAGAPMIAEGVVIGVLWTGRNTEFEDDDVRILNSIADIASSALRRMTLHGEAKQRLERLHALRSVDLAVHTSGNIDHVFEVVLDQVMRQLRVDAADILPYDIVSEGLLPGPDRTSVDAPPLVQPSEELPPGLALRVARERRIIETTAIAAAIQSSSRDRLHAEAGYATYVGVPLVAEGELRGVLELLHREAFATDKDVRAFLEAVAWQAANAIDRARMVEELRLAHAELMDAYDTTLEGWSQALELRDGEPAGHTRRVTDLAVDLARALGMDESDVVHVRRGALLHDLGKMAIPDAVLLKAGPLTEEEWEAMRRHPQHAADLLSQIPHLWPALDIPYSHHERWDGSGYPDGLAGEDIPLAARLFAVIDVWDALRTTKPYRDALDDRETMTYLEQNAGRLFDPHVVEVFLDMVRFAPSLPRG